MLRSSSSALRVSSDAAAAEEEEAAMTRVEAASGEERSPSDAIWLSDSARTRLLRARRR